MFKTFKYNKLIPAIFIMILIFIASAQPSAVSSQISGGLTKKILAAVAKIFTSVEAENWEHWHGFVRKNAHFFGYFALALLSRWGIKGMGYRHYNRIALFLCILYAMTDELHQRFVPGRSAEIRDVLIDTAGASLGLAIAVGLESIKRRKKSNQ